VTKLTKHRIIGIGFCSGHVCIDAILPGQRELTWGYHSDDGNVYENGAEMKYGPKFGKGDIVGCGVDWQIEAYFFTLNGQFLGK
jgi:Ran-binding protein 9/10